MKEIHVDIRLSLNEWGQFKEVMADTGMNASEAASVLVGLELARERQGRRTLRSEGKR